MPAAREPRWGALWPSINNLSADGTAAPIRLFRKAFAPEFRKVTLIGLVMLAGFLVRIINIDQPFVDRWSYRQSDVAMVARNFYQHGYHILSPRIDYGGAQPGYVGMEFPVVPFMGAALYQPFGEREAIGRAVSLIFFMLSVPPLFLLVEMIANKRTALLAICFYTLMPLTIFCGRSFISDMAANSFAIWAVWLFARWLQDGSHWRWFAAALATAAAVLTKAPYVIVGFPVAYLAVKRFGVGAFFRRELWLFSFLALVPSVLWYSYAVAITRSNYPNIAFLGHPDHFLVLLPIEKYVEICKNIVGWLTPEIMLLALIGLTSLRRKLDCRLFLWWCVGMALLVIFAGDDNYRHVWYQLPMTAAVAALAGIAADSLLSRSPEASVQGRVIVPLMVAATGLITYQSFSFVRIFYTPVAEPLLAAGKAVDRLVPQDALVLFASWGNPTAIYYSRRHGWLFSEHFVAPSNGSEAISMLEMRRNEGASYFVITNWENELRHPPYSLFWRYLETHFKETSSGPQFTIFDLGTVPDGALSR